MANSIKLVNERQRDSFVVIHLKDFQECFTQISGNAFKLFFLLRSYSDSQYKPVFPSISKLAEKMGCSQDSINRYLKELVTLNLIAIKKARKSNRNIYHFERGQNSESEKFVTDTRKFADTAKPNTSNDAETINREIGLEYLQKCRNIITNKIQKQDHNKTTTTSDDVAFLALYREHEDLILKCHRKQGLFDDLFLETLYKDHLPEKVRFMAFYMFWAANRDKLKVQNPVGFLRWLLKNPAKCDYKEYMDYLRKRWEEKRILEYINKPKNID